MSSIAPCFVGIDVSKATLDIALVRGTERETFRVTNDAAGHDALVARLAPIAPARIALEATGGLERPSVAHLAAAGLPVARVNPRQARDFARATGLLAKTDRIDAWMLARMAETLRPAQRPLPSAEQAELTAWSQRRRQLVDLRKTERQRLSDTRNPDIADQIRDVIETLSQLIEQTEARIDQLIAAHDQFRAKQRLLRSVKGVGPVASAAILAEMPELGSITNKQAASLLGVAPHACDSGKYRGRRRCWGGRRALRQTLYMAAETARRYGTFKTTYENLRSAGKSHKLAVIAVLRKLITTLNAILRDTQPYKPKHSC
jgi:transposase